MLDIVHWSAALLALIGLFLWFWSAGIHVPQTAEGTHVADRRKRQIRRAAICAATVSALLQAAATSAAPAQLNANVELWASTAPAHISPIG
ncbi:MAG: hypothetical protein ACREFI_06950 [Stellaceae bacterium]